MPGPTCCATINIPAQLIIAQLILAQLIVAQLILAQLIVAQLILAERPIYSAVNQGPLKRPTIITGRLLRISILPLAIDCETDCINVLHIMRPSLLNF